MVVGRVKSHVCQQVSNLDVEDLYLECLNWRSFISLEIGEVSALFKGTTGNEKSRGVRRAVLWHQHSESQEILATCGAAQLRAPGRPPDMLAGPGQRSRIRSPSPTVNGVESKGFHLAIGHSRRFSSTDICYRRSNARTTASGYVIKQRENGTGPISLAALARVRGNPRLPKERPSCSVWLGGRPGPD